METRKVKLPVGYVGEGGVYRTAILKPLTGRALLRARQKLGDAQDPGLFLDVLQECVAGFEGLTGSFDVERMFWADADFIFRELAVWEAQESGEPLQTQRACTECGRQVTITVNPEEQEVVPVEETAFGKRPDFLIPFKLRVPVTTLDPEGTPYYEGKLGLLTVGDEIGRMKRYARQPGKLWSEGLRLMIYELGPKKKGELTLADIEQMSASDLKRLEALYLENEPGLKPLPDPVCPYCGRRFTPDIPVNWVFDFLLTPGLLGRRS